MPNSFRREIWISVALIGGGVAALSAALYILSGNITSETDKIVADRALIAKRAEAIAALAELKRDATMVQPYRDAMAKLLVSQDKLFDFQHWLEGLASQRQVSVSFSFDGTQTLPQSGSPGFNGFSVVVNGNNMQNIIEFAKDMEYRAPEFLVNVSSFEASKNGGSYAATMHGQIFFVNNPVNNILNNPPAQ